MTANAVGSVAARKKLGKRALREHSQTLRHTFQLAFLLLNLWIGVQFCLFVRYYETGGRSMLVNRPAGVEGWLPIASLMNLKVLILTGHIVRCPCQSPGTVRTDEDCVLWHRKERAQAKDISPCSAGGSARQSNGDDAPRLPFKK